MKRRDFVRLAGAGVLAPSLGRAAWWTTPARASGDARWPGYDDAIVIDALAGPIQFNIPQESLPLGSAALEAVRTSGITAVNLTVNARGDGEASAYERSLARIDAWFAEAEHNPDLFSVVRGIADIRAAKETGRLALVLGFQDTVPVEDDPARLDEFHARRVRIVQLTYNVENQVVYGCLAPRDDGLKAFGRDVVERLDELGILIDLSHCGASTTVDGIRASRRPVSITHSGCKALFDHPRSKSDETMRELAERGGVFGVYLMPFLNAEGPPSADHVIAHVEHALNVCGEDHVGIGSDQGIVPLDVSGDFPRRFDAVSAQRAAAGIAAPREDTIPYVPDLNHPRRMETIADMLAARGHPDRIIEKVLGANFLRLFEEVWG